MLPVVCFEETGGSTKDAPALLLLRFKRTLDGAFRETLQPNLSEIPSAERSKRANQAHALATAV
jgi:hypothetical protein